MNRSAIDRRVHDGGGVNAMSGAALVRIGIRIRKETGAVSAIEYLTSVGVSAAVIQRVLCGVSIRVEDSTAFAH